MLSQRKIRTFGMLLRALHESDKSPHELVGILHRKRGTIYDYLAPLLTANKIEKVTLHTSNRGRPKTTYKLIDETGWDVIYV